MQFAVVQAYIQKSRLFDEVVWLGALAGGVRTAWPGGEGDHRSDAGGRGSGGSASSSKALARGALSTCGVLIAELRVQY